MDKGNMDSGSRVAKPESFQQICRTCLHTDELFLIDEVRSDISLRIFLSKWIKFEEKYEHKMPQYICNSCIKTIADVQYFVIKIQNIDVSLKNAISNNKMLHPQEFKHLPQCDVESNLSHTIKEEDVELIVIKYENSDNLDEIENTSVVANHKKPDNKIDTKPLSIKMSKTSENIKKSMNIAKILDTELIYFCGLCKKGFNTHEKMKLHKKKEKHFRGGAIYICPYCKKSTKIHGKLIEHLRMHNNEKPNLCSSCGKAFTTKGDLSRHVKNVHLKKRSNKCHFCYRYIENLKEHEKTHANIDYVCSFCEKSFKYHKYWYNHERTHRKKGLRKKYTARQVQCEYQCDDCAKIYVTKQAFEEHCKEHKGIKYECDLCKKVFPTDMKMKKHRNFVHSEARFTCETCGHTVKQKNILENHIKSVHKGEKMSYECQYCEKVFYNKACHKQHQRIHTNDTTYQCKICSKICTTNRKLMAHLRVHTGERPYKCERCDKRFSAKENMTVHMKSHAGPPPHQCSICSRAFYVNCQLQNHIRRVHDKKEDEKASGKKADDVGTA